MAREVGKREWTDIWKCACLHVCNLIYDDARWSSYNEHQVMTSRSVEGDEERGEGKGNGKGEVDRGKISQQQIHLE